MKGKKVNIKKILYITFLVVLSIILVASLVFGTIAAFTDTLRTNIEVWYSTKFDKEISLLKTSVIWLIISSLLIVLTLLFDDFKKKFINN